jgi:hypothetical protein
MPSGGSKRQGTFHPVAFSAALSSPSPHLLHLLIFSTSSSRSPPPRRVLHLLAAFSTSSSRSPLPPRILHSGVMFTISLSCHLRWYSPRRRRFGLEYLTATVQRMAHGRRGRAVALLPSRPALHSLVVVRFVGHYAGVVFRCCGCRRVSRRGGRYAGGGCWVGLEVVSGGRGKGTERKGPQRMLWTTFATYWRRSLLLLLLPLFFVVVTAPHHPLAAFNFLAPRFLHRASMSPPTSLWKGEGRVRAGRFCANWGVGG